MHTTKMDSKHLAKGTCGNTRLPILETVVCEIILKYSCFTPDCSLSALSCVERAAASVGWIFFTAFTFYIFGLYKTSLIACDFIKIVANERVYIKNERLKMYMKHSNKIQYCEVNFANGLLGRNEQDRRTCFKPTHGSNSCFGDLQRWADAHHCVRRQELQVPSLVW